MILHKQTCSRNNKITHHLKKKSDIHFKIGFYTFLPESDTKLLDGFPIGVKPVMYLFMLMETNKLLKNSMHFM